MHEMGRLKFGLNSFFIEFYVKVNGWTGSPVLVSNKAGSLTFANTSGYSISLSPNSDAWRVNLADGDTSSVVTVMGNGIKDGNWHHLAMVVDRENGNVDLYQDATFIRSAPLGSRGTVTRSGAASITVGRSTAF